MPPDAPNEGQNSNLSNFFGANFLIKGKSKSSFFVSCKQKILALLSSILFRIGSHLALSFSPRTFQHKIFQDLQVMETPTKKQAEHLVGHSHHRLIEGQQKKGPNKRQKKHRSIQKFWSEQHNPPKPKERLPDP
jgi:hypothetical protein